MTNEYNRTIMKIVINFNQSVKTHKKDKKAEKQYLWAAEEM